MITFMGTAPSSLTYNDVFTASLSLNERNSTLYEKYQELARKEDKVIFGGRLGMYQYFDMWQVIDEALKVVKSLK